MEVFTVRTFSFLFIFRAVGMGLPFSREAVLLLAGIRPFSIQTPVVNSLIETNSGVLNAFWIYTALNRRKKPD